MAAARARRLATGDEPPAVGRSHFNLSSGAATAVVFVSILLCFVLLCTYCRCARQRAIAGARRRIVRELSERVPAVFVAGASAALPVLAYAGVRKKKGHPPGADCAVCLEVFVDGDDVKVAPDCGHVFHAACLDQWLDERNTCPICRRAVVVRHHADRGRGAAVAAGDDQELVLERVVAMIEAIREEEAAAARRAPASDEG